MPALPASSSERVPPQPTTIYYLSNPSPSATSLLPIPSPDHLQTIPSSTLLFSFTHPHLPTSESTRFFLTCLPDPIGFLYHSTSFIRAHLNFSSSIVSPSNWRHQLIELVLENEPGLAATSGGKIHVSLQWVTATMHEVRDGKRDMQEAVQEFKGVCESIFPLIRPCDWY